MRASQADLRVDNNDGRMRAENLTRRPAQLGAGANGIAEEIGLLQARGGPYRRF